MEPTDRVTNQRELPQWLAWGVGLLVLARVLTVVFFNAEGRELVKWVSLAQAQPAARISGKLIMYDFSAAWCGPCRTMDAAVFRDQKSAARINATVVPVRVIDRKQEDGRNSPDVEALQRRYDVRAFPTIVIADARGEVRQRVEGFRGRSAFFEVLTAAARNVPRGIH